MGAQRSFSFLSLCCLVCMRACPVTFCVRRLSVSLFLSLFLGKPTDKPEDLKKRRMKDPEAGLRSADSLSFVSRLSSVEEDWCLRLLSPSPVAQQSSWCKCVCDGSMLSFFSLVYRFPHAKRSLWYAWLAIEASWRAPGASDGGECREASLSLSNGLSSAGGV